MRRQRTGDDDVAAAARDHVRQHAAHVLHDHVDVQVEHAVDGVVVGVHQIAAHVEPGVGVEHVEPATQREDALGHGGALRGVQQVQYQRQGGAAQRVAGFGQGLGIAVDQHDLCAGLHHGLGAGETDARCGARDGGHLAIQRVGRTHVLAGS